MRALMIAIPLVALALAGSASKSAAEEKFERKERGEWKEEYKDARCEIKRERTSCGEFKKEVKCK